MSYLICGIDEVGRGCLAGPIVAVAALFVVPEKTDFTSGCPVKGVKDSKAFSNENRREEIYHSILKCESLVDFGIGESSVEEINKQGITEANRLVFYRALKDLKQEPNFVLVDGDNPCPTWEHSRQKWAPKGDAKWWPVSAASILAKVIRDWMMAEFHQDYPQYGWDNNAGYGTTIHRQALRAHGSTPLHRTQFISKILAGGMI